MKAPATLALIFLAAGCAVAPTRDSGRIDFALIGDMPYDGRQEKEFDNLMRDIDAADVAFVIHDGDFWWDGGAWTEQAAVRLLEPCLQLRFGGTAHAAGKKEIT